MKTGKVFLLFIVALMYGNQMFGMIELATKVGKGMWDNKVKIAAVTGTVSGVSLLSYFVGRRGGYDRGHDRGLEAGKNKIRKVFDIKIKNVYDLGENSSVPENWYKWAKNDRKGMLKLFDDTHPGYDDNVNIENAVSNKMHNLQKAGRLCGEKERGETILRMLQAVGSVDTVLTGDPTERLKSLLLENYTKKEAKKIKKLSTMSEEGSKDDNEEEGENED